jgi:cell wall-associated NlpC family hydrolase
VVKLVVSAVACIALWLPSIAAGGAYAKVIGPDGRVLAEGSGSRFVYPSDGSLVQVGIASSVGGNSTLNAISLLGGLVNISQIDVFGNGQVALGSVAAAGRVITPATNTLVSLGSAGYIVLNQTAIAGNGTGHVALRLVLQQPTDGVPQGTQILIGTPSPPRPTTTSALANRAGGFDPLAVLGFSGTTIAPGTFGTALTGSSLGDRAVAIAEQYLGVPYVWGGASPVPGFDCSGLALYVYAQLGVKLTHYTGAQYFEGARVPFSDLMPGDLLFFDPDPTLGPQHEGIYLGDGQFIQAPHTGDVVRISSLSDPTYSLAFVGAVRPYAP